MPVIQIQSATLEDTTMTSSEGSGTTMTSSEGSGSTSGSSGSSSGEGSSSMSSSSSSSSSSGERSTVSNLIDSIKLSANEIVTKGSHRMDQLFPGPTTSSLSTSYEDEDSSYGPKGQTRRSKHHPVKQQPHKQQPNTKDKRHATPGLSFTTMTASLSSSSEDISEKIGKTFGYIYKGKQDTNESSDNSDGAMPLMESKSTGDYTSSSEEHKSQTVWSVLGIDSVSFGMPGAQSFTTATTNSTDQNQTTKSGIESNSQRARTILDVIATNSTDESTNLKTHKTEATTTYWGDGFDDVMDEQTTNDESVQGSSLLDADGETDDEGISYFTVGDETLEESVFEDDETVDDDYVGPVTVQGVLYQIGTCTLGGGDNVDDDTYSVSSGMFPQLVESSSSRGRSRSPRTPIGEVKTDKVLAELSTNTPSQQANESSCGTGILQSVFGCGRA